MSGESRCSARPSDLIDYAREADDAVWQLRNALHNFDRDTGPYRLLTVGFFRMLGYSDPIWNSALELEDMASWVSHVGWAFAIAGAGGDSATAAIVSADAAAVDQWLEPIDWNPAKNLRSGEDGDWLRALGPLCRGFSEESGYQGSGFIVGPDGRSYPLVAPFVTRDGEEYQADNGLQPGQRSVLELDGRDPGWTTIFGQTGVERWRDAPDIGERILMGIGSTVAGRPNGSSKSDVEQLVLIPGMKPYVGAVPERPTSEPTPPPYMVPNAPNYAPPGRPDTVYPGANPRSAAGSGVPILIEGMGGAMMADQGSHAAYDVVFQQNADGRVRALYKRVYVGFDDNGKPYTDSVWVTGPENNDHVLINYAP
jgi:hypothetical protein